MKVHNLLVTGSLTSGGENITAISSSVSSTVTSLSSSVSTSIGQLSSSMVSSMTSLSSSLTSSMGSLSSSMATSMNDLSSSMGSIMATTGSNLFKGNQTISGSIIPAVNGLYDLGSITNEFRDLYLSSASLYIDGTKVLGSTTQELTITTDAGQSFKILEAGSDTITLQAADGNITLATSGGGDVILDPTTGVIALKGTTTLYAGNKILSSDGNAIQIGNSVTMTGSLIVTGFIETQELRTTYISSSILYRSGSTKFGDEVSDTHSFTGSLSVSGSISVPDSGLVSGSSQITYSGLSGVPSGIISGSAQLPSGLVSGSVQVLNGSGVFSGSAQLPSGIVSGSVQIDVMSTTNIARLATTGSNSFSGNQTITNSGRPYFIANTSNAGEEAGIKIQQSTVSDWYIGTAQGTTSAQDIAIRDVKNSRVPFAISESTGDISLSGNILVGTDKGIKFDSSGASGHPEISVDSNVDLNFKNSAGLTNLKLKNNGDTIISGSITSTGTVSAGTTINWNGGIGALSYGSGIVTLETNTANQIQLKTNGSAAITISTGQTVTFANNIGLGVTPITKLHLQGSSPNYILLTNTAADGVGNAIQGGIIGQSRGYSNNLSQMASILFRNENSAAWYKGEITFNTNGSDGTNPDVSPTERLRIASGGNIGVNDAAPSKLLTVNFGTSISDGLLVTGTQRQETRFKSSGEHSNVFIDSGHSNIYLPTLALLRSGTSFGEVKLQRASNSDSIGAFAESEMIIGSTTSVPFSIKTNEVRRIRVASGGGVEVFNSLSVSGNLTARNFSRSIKTWSPAGSTGSGTSVTYNWADELAALSSNFDSGAYYKGYIRSGNGAHYYGYHFDILVGSIGYGSNSLQFKIQNLVVANAPWVGGCGFSPFGTVDTTSFVHNNNPCGEVLELSITRLGV
jgi:trimeric autotransporter adhesin